MSSTITLGDNHLNFPIEEKDTSWSDLKIDV